MPIKQSAMKALRQTQTRTKRNDQVRDGLEYMRRTLRKAIEAGDTKKVQEMVKTTITAIDKAVQKKVLKLNTGSRLKSRIMASAKKLSAKK